MNDIVLAVLLCVGSVGLFIAGYGAGVIMTERCWLAWAHEAQLRRWLEIIGKQAGARE